MNHARRDLCGGHPAMDVPTAMMPLFPREARLQTQLESLKEAQVNYFETDSQTRLAVFRTVADRNRTGVRSW